MLRLPLLLARSVHMCNRKKLVNWIRICRRLGVLYEKAPLFRSLKLKWNFFNRWLKVITLTLITVIIIIIILIV